jgi:hypothetical protein
VLICINVPEIRMELPTFLNLPNNDVTNVVGVRGWNEEREKKNSKSLPLEYLTYHSGALLRALTVSSKCVEVRRIQPEFFFTGP